MIVYLCGDSVIEKSVLFTSLQLIKPENLEILSELSIEEASLSDAKDKIVLKIPDMKVKDTRVCKKLIKENHVKFLEIPALSVDIEEALSAEVNELTKSKIQVEQLPTSKYHRLDFEALGNAMQDWLEENTSAKFPE